MRGLDIAVAGCGPAGLAAALMLHRDGHRIRLFERFETPRPIGSGIMLQPTGLAVLRSLGLDADILTAAARIDRLYGRAEPSGKVVLDVRYRALGRGAGFGLGLHRATLFDTLFRAVEACGVSTETNRPITGLDSGPGPCLVFADGARAGPFDLVVDALGSGTPLSPPTGRSLAYGALWASLDWPQDAGLTPDILEQRYRRASIMAGVLPIGLGPASPRRQAALFWSLRQDQLGAWRQAGLAAWKDQVHALWPATAPLLAQIHHPEALTFARYTHRTLASPVAQGLAHIGDAWHSASPQLGQGANMAMLDAYALAKALREGGGLETALPRYAALRRTHVGLYQLMSTLFTPVYQSDGTLLPLVRDRLVGPISRLWPATVIQAAMVAGLVGDPLGHLALPAQAQDGPS
ncbi:MAG: glutamate synthase [Caulobacteraceae bacterium]|nr:glutamate synthase [Caulobacteraceae bacterium]